MPTHAIDLGQGQPAGKGHHEHVPQPLLEFLRIDTLGHFVPADHAARWKAVLELHLVELAAGNIAEDYSKSPGHDQFAFATVTCWLQESRIGLEKTMDLHRVIPRLSQGIGFDHASPLSVEHSPITVDFRQCLRFPVLDFQDQDSAVGVQDNEVGVPVTGTDGYVVPAKVIVFQLVFEALREAPFAGRHPPCAGSAVWNQRSQGIAPQDPVRGRERIYIRWAWALNPPGRRGLTSTGTLVQPRKKKARLRGPSSLLGQQAAYFRPRNSSSGSTLGSLPRNSR